MSTNTSDNHPHFRALFFQGDLECHAMEVRDALVKAVRSDELLWIDAQGQSGMLARELGLDLDLLDASSVGDTGMATRGAWTYLHVRALNRSEGGAPHAVPMVVVVGDNRLITLREGAIPFLDRVWEHEASRLRVGRMFAMSFAAGLLDRMLTDYMDARDDFETRLDKIEHDILVRARTDQLRHLQHLRQTGSRLRQLLASQRDLFDALGRPDFAPNLPEAVEAHCRAVSRRYSKVVQAIEQARELINGSFNLYTSRSSESTNQAMHTLTVVTVVMGLAATIAGVLGMNFSARLFEAGEGGFWTAAGVIGGVVLLAIGWAIYRHIPRS